MSDDLANDWGCDLICMGRSSGRKRKVGATIAILADDRRQRNFHSLIEKTTNNLFGLMKLTTNGSDMNGPKSFVCSSTWRSCFYIVMSEN